MGMARTGQKAFGRILLAAFFFPGLLLALGLAAWMGSLRGARQYRTDPPVASGLQALRIMPGGIEGTPPEVYFALGKPYAHNAYDLSQGKRLYSWFGCPSCHGDGRGASGPSFLDGWWLYGPGITSIVASIRDGRPHGMPAFRDKMSIDQIWQLAGYIQTIGAYSARMGAPGRNDDSHTRPAENRAPASILFDERPVGANPQQGPTP
ncbi:c-type cytochrome [Rhizobium sp. YTU87027]|uniref:c-type cytochrome n=1 Tax=Rhizobium sp. YTU87027 TaxID=3417741 RepID=UPI003D68B46D